MGVEALKDYTYEICGVSLNCRARCFPMSTELTFANKALNIGQ